MSEPAAPPIESWEVLDLLTSLVQNSLRARTWARCGSVLRRLRPELSAAISDGYRAAKERKSPERGPWLSQDVSKVNTHRPRRPRHWLQPRTDPRGQLQRA